jgi:hypothetical protein
LDFGKSTPTNSTFNFNSENVKKLALPLDANSFLHEIAGRSGAAIPFESLNIFYECFPKQEVKG